MSVKDEIQRSVETITERLREGSIELIEYGTKWLEIIVLHINADDNQSDVFQQMDYNIELKSAILATQGADTVDTQIREILLRALIAGLNAAATAAIAKI